MQCVWINTLFASIRRGRAGLRRALAPVAVRVFGPDQVSLALRSFQAALRNRSGGSVACMLGRASIRPSQAFSLVPAIIFAPSGVAAR
jgi:hypothetical protein